MFPYFVRDSSQSALLHSLFTHLIGSFSTALNRKINVSISTEDLFRLFLKTLFEVCTATFGKNKTAKVVLVIDGLDELQQDGVGWLPGRVVRALAWLPAKLPTNCCFLFSCADQEVVARFVVTGCLLTMFIYL